MSVTFLLIPALPRSVFMVFYGSSLVFHGSGSIFMVFHGSRSVFMAFHGSGWVFMVPGWFIMVPGWFFMDFLQNIPASNCILARRSSLGPRHGT